MKKTLICTLMMLIACPVSSLAETSETGQALMGPQKTNIPSDKTGQAQHGGTPTPVIPPTSAPPVTTSAPPYSTTSAPPSVTSPNPVTPPVTKTLYSVNSLSAIPGNGQVILSWINPNKVSDVMVIYKSGTDPDTPNTGNLFVNSETSVVITRLENNTTYYFYVYVSDGNGIYSKPVSISAKPDMPKDLIIVENDLSLYITCAQYKEIRYEFILRFAPDLEPNVFYWKMDVVTLKNTQNVRNGCLRIGDDLALNISAKYQDVVYDFILEYGQDDAKHEGLCWKMSLSSFKTVGS